MSVAWNIIILIISRLGPAAPAWFIMHLLIDQTPGMMQFPMYTTRMWHKHNNYNYNAINSIVSNDRNDDVSHNTFPAAK